MGFSQGAKLDISSFQTMQNRITYLGPYRGCGACFNSVIHLVIHDKQLIIRTVFLSIPVNQVAYNGA